MNIRYWSILLLPLATGCGAQDTRETPRPQTAIEVEKRPPEPAGRVPETVRGKSLQQWLGQLERGTVLQRREAVGALAEFRDYPGDEFVHRSNPLTGELEPTRAGDAFVQALTRALADADFQVRRDAAHLLGKLGPKARAAEPALRKALDDEEPAVREAAAEALERVNPDQPAPPPTDAEFAEQLKRLDPKTEKEARLRALGWIGANSGPGNAALAIPALEKCIRGDPEAEVRQRAVGALGQLARRLGKPCPLVIFEALHDKEDFVRYEAVVRAGLFKSFAPGSADVLLRGVTADNAELRSSSLMLLARVAGKDPKALAAMEKATRDKVLDVRHSAHVALFIARDRLEEHIPYLIRVREDPASFLSPGPEDSEDGKRERAYRNLVLLGTAVQVIDWSETRADELAGVLLKLLTDDSAVMRRGAARLIGAAAVKQEVPLSRKVDPLAPLAWNEGSLQSLLPYIDPQADALLKKDGKPAPAPQKSKVAGRLEQLGVEATLRKLRDGDPDRSVRDAAGWALDRLAGVPGKKP